MRFLGRFALLKWSFFGPKWHAVQKMNNMRRLVKMHTKRISGFPQIGPNSSENQSAGLLRDALRESRSKIPMLLEGVLGLRIFGGLWDVLGAFREAPGELWSSSGYVLETSRLILLRTKAP